MLIQHYATRSTRKTWVRLTAFALAVMLCTGLITVLANEAIRKINVLNIASSDNVQWTLSQSEVEFLNFYYAAVNAEAQPDEDLSELRKWFDIFYSRLDTIQHGSLYSELNQQPNLKSAFGRVDEFMAKTIPLIDGPDAALRLALPEITRVASELHDVVREISLESIKTFAHQSDLQRESVSKTMILIAAVTGVLVVVLLVLVFFLARLYRISQGQAMENQLTRDRLEAMLKTSLDAVLVVDAMGRFIEFDGAAEVIFGYTKAEAIGQPMIDLIYPPGMITQHQVSMANLAGTDPEQAIGKGQMQRLAKRKSGEIFPVELSIAKAQSREGEILVAFLRDISDRISAETKLLNARDDAQAGERAKAHFLAVMSHEMRTPLNGLLGTLDLIQRTKLEAKQAEYLSIMQASGRLLLHHVNDVLDISKLEAGRPAVDKTAFHLENLIQELLDGQVPLASSNGNTLRLIRAAQEIGPVLGDAVGLRQVLLNLIGNAIKFTHSGTITVEAAELHTTDTEKLVEIVVTDTGIGIAEEDLGRIFEDFVTLDTSFGRRAEGTGLGLGIARRVIRTMAGEIGAESEPGEGSLFWLRLPLQVPETLPQALPSPPDRPRAPAIAAQKVLVVEDNEINRFIVCEMLQADGHHVICAKDGKEGVRLAEATAFDLILMDISMPHLNGIDATRKIRAGNGASAATRIIALTAHALPADLKQFEAAGMNGTLIKPLDSTSLAAILGAAGTQRLNGKAMNFTALPSDDDVLVDRESLSDLRDSIGNEKTTVLLARFLSEGDASIRAIFGHAENRDLAAFRREIHSLAGSAATFGVRRLCRVLTTIDVQSQASHPEQLADTLPDLAILWTATRDAIKAA